MRVKRLASGALAALWALALPLCVPLGTQAEVTDAQALGTIVHYNGVVFNRFASQQADVEGALAVGGTSRIGYGGDGYDFGGTYEDMYAPTVHIGQYTNPNGYPTLLLGGEPALGKPDGSTGHINVYGGKVVMAQSLQAGYESSGRQFSATNGVDYAADSLVEGFFTSAYTQTVQAGEIMANANNQPESFMEFTLADLRNENMANLEADNLVNDDLNVLSINYTDAGSLDIDSIYFPGTFSEYDLILLNFPEVTQANFKSNNLYVDGQEVYAWPRDAQPKIVYQLLSHYSGRVIWNFPNATDITTTEVSITGSVLAPNASVTSKGGSINGMLIAQNFETTGSMELHAFRMSDAVFKLRNPEPDKETGTLRVTKYDGNNATVLLEDASFTLQVFDDGEWLPYNGGEVYTTDENGELIVKGLPEGYYRLIETAPPVGYELDDDPQYFMIEAGSETGLSVYLPTANYEHVIEPDPIDVTLYKTDGTSNLEGAIFTFYQIIDGDPVELYDVPSATDGSITLRGLTEGEYRLKEISPPGGHAVVDEYDVIFIYIVPNGQGGLTAEVSNHVKDLEPPYEIVNMPTGQPVQNRLEIVKLEHSDGRTTLQGAVFDLHWYNEETLEWDCLFEDLITDQYGQIILEDLPCGEYMLEETSPPEGCEYSTEDEECGYYYRTWFTMPESEDGETVFVQRDVYNLRTTEIEGDSALTIFKTDALTGEGLSGASFRLSLVLNESDPPILVEEFTVDESGSYTIAGLLPGEYLLEELEAPAGYAASTQGVHLTLQSGAQQEVTVPNWPEDEPDPSTTTSTSGASSSSSTLASSSSGVSGSSSALASSSSGVSGSSSALASSSSGVSGSSSGVLASSSVLSGSSSISESSRPVSSEVVGSSAVPESQLSSSNVSQTGVASSALVDSAAPALVPQLGSSGTVRSSSSESSASRGSVSNSAVGRGASAASSRTSTGTAASNTSGPATNVTKLSTNQGQRVAAAQTGDSTSWTGTVVAIISTTAVGAFILLKLKQKRSQA